MTFESWFIRNRRGCAKHILPWT